MTNGWTGGQYSLFRAIFGTYLFVHFVQLAPWAAEVFSNIGLLRDGSLSPLLSLFPNIFALWDGPAFVTGVVILASLLSFAFAIGWHDRGAAVALWYIWACLHGRMPLTSNPGLPFVGWMLLAHACLPAAPYGSLAARSRIDPGNNWRFPSGIFLVAWILMSVGYSYSGLTKLDSPSWIDGSALAHVLNNPLARPGWPRDVLLSLPTGILRLATWGALALEIGFGPLALMTRLRPRLWTLMLFMHLSLIAVIDFADLSLGMVMLHLFTFDPGWIKSLAASGPATMFYDGECGLCHRAVRFALAEDRRGDQFRFAPLQGETFRTTIAPELDTPLPDSFVVLTPEGTILTRSAGVLYMLKRLGGAWRVIAALGGVVPRLIADALYDVVARSRKKIFATPANTCPMLPKALQARFDP
jgi:predicted DCC family thiol-disulfide oxidoreductase YuxK